jgi:hypothetical protein
MPTPNCHHLSSVLASMFQSTSDKIAWAAAGVAGSAPLWSDYFQHVNDAAVRMGPTLAAIFVCSKTILVWVQIFKERAKPPREDE